MRTATVHLRKQDRLNGFRCKKVGKFVRHLSSLLIVSILGARYEVTVRHGGFGRKYEMVVWESERANGPALCSVISRQCREPTEVVWSQKQCETREHRWNVLLWPCAALQRNEHFENRIQEDQSFTRRVWWRMSEPREVTLKKKVIITLYCGQI